MEIKQFTPDRIDSVAAMAAKVWGKEQGAHSSEAARLFCQHLTRYSLYSTDLAFQAEDEEGMQAIAFAWLPGDTNDAASWLRSQLPNMTDKGKQTLLTNERYLTRTDAELQPKMLPNSAKLSFFISQKPGYGTPVLNALIERLRERGIEWLYLWTDCTCNWEYYPKHGYELIGEGTVPEFSTDAEVYTYRMFRKKIKQ
jgi:GNAT superfamily N-acetyltransferase